MGENGGRIAITARTFGNDLLMDVADNGPGQISKTEHLVEKTA